MIKNQRNKKENAITLIALVITIIVLLILAGVSIAILTGDNGILNQANKAKTETSYKGAEEKAKLAVMGARADDGQMTVEELEREIGYQGGTLLGAEFPVEVTVDEYTFTVDNAGTVSRQIKNDTLGTVTGTETTNTMVRDKLGNIVKVPAGFKVVNPTETVPDGIVIEDVTHEATKGSQFVWIPVGTVKKSDGTTETITLSRYTFDETGKETDQGENTISSCKELSISSNNENMIAKDILKFRKKSLESKGYYIGRYEARDKDATEARTDSTSDANQLVYTEDNYVYNYVTQLQAAELSRNMYRVSNFESDLMNSYAWDTAMIFMQKFDNRENKTETTKPYSKQNSINNILSEKGTNKLSVPDKICNVYDMASNCDEWSTESVEKEINKGVKRAGDYAHTNYYADTRYSIDITRNYIFNSFRTIIYL